MRIHLATWFMVLLLLIASLTLAQAGKKSLSVDDIEGLLKGGVTTARVASLIGERGVAFEMSRDARARLERAGADAKVIAAIESAAAVRVPAQVPGQTERERLAEPEPTEAPARTALIVRTNVSGDDVQIDGKSVGSSGPTPHDVSPGRHGIVVRREGYRTMERNVVVRQGETEIVRLELRPIEEPASAGYRYDEEKDLFVFESAGGMVLVPGGSFFMGCNEAADNECDSDEKPGRIVDVPAFRIDKTEVSVADYRECFYAGRCEAPDEKGSGCTSGKQATEFHPINCVSWDQAVAFCKWQGKRLPTETEWEKAARGTDRRKYPWGNAGYGSGGKVANICDANCEKDWKLAGYDDGYPGPAPAGRFPAGASPYGALDMVGNLSEWVADSYPDEFGVSRVVRGGHWNDLPQNARASGRFWTDPSDRYDYIGFRCAR